MTGKDVIKAKDRISAFMRQRRTIRIGLRLWIQRMVDVGTIRRVR